ncbi:60S ribosomal protein L22-2 [Hibiscus syriacus]|uniref:Large ribosomal subunit protein eL22 n=1 Tax=Hibiscus syriacus TaxID=106335 RepID=A0A6A2XML7_HIBSY|nr:60S ribosomal protein L22-2 [Hibiscus syriacus]
MSRGAAARPKGKKKGATFTIDCSKPVDDKIMDIALLEKFLQERIKVGGKLVHSVILSLSPTKRTESPSCRTPTFPSGFLHFSPHLLANIRSGCLRAFDFAGLESFCCFKPSLDWPPESFFLRRALRATAALILPWMYVKYLTKKYLKKHNVRDWLWVIASNKDRSVYELRYFNVADNEGEEEE